MEVIRNTKYKNRDYTIVDTMLKIEKGESSISTPIHIRVDITGLPEKDRAIVFGKVSGAFNHLLVMRNKQQVATPKPWWKKIFN
jgi:hypothetical protein